MKKRKLIIKSTFTFDKKAAKKMVNAQYYAAEGSNYKNLAYIEEEKQRLSPPKIEDVTRLLDCYKNLGLSEEGKSPIGKILLAIYNKNKRSAKIGEKAINTNLISLVSHPETLLLAYREIRGNKGALTPGAEKTPGELSLMTDDQLKLYLETEIFPDGFSLQHIFLTSRLIRKQLYPWGISSRIYIDKPGVNNKKRPIPIPPFMDRVVQKAIDMVLQCIYEPYFEKMNRSFGFRPNKGVHDAIAVIRSTKTNGMRTAIEGDVEKAYDTVDKEKLLKILEERIKDSKFLKLMKQRLNYTYIEKETGERVTPSVGIPQGGIDSPYLFNIYMHELDTFIHKKIQEYVDILNQKPNRNAQDKRYRAIMSSMNRLFKSLNEVKEKFRQIRQSPTYTELERETLLRPYKMELYSIVRAIRITHHYKNRVSSTDHSKRIITFIYVRYADDWILLTNGSKEIANTIKSKIAVFLREVLKLELSETKTLITDITKTPAKFLGFEIRRNVRGILQKQTPKGRMPIGSYRKHNLQKAGGVLVWTAPDRQRLINRLHMKGYCDKKGFPTHIPWLITFEPHIIIERFNASIRGLFQYYIGHTRSHGSIYRWIYILRYSCLKTLANKYQTSITQIFHRFGHNMASINTQTVRFKILLNMKENIYEKTWDLLTYKELVDKRSPKQISTEAISLFWKVEKGELHEYPLKQGKIPKVTNENYLDAISWVSLRTQASFDMPCASCGTFENIQMHQIKHVRKTAYVLIPEETSYKRIMQLRNRKQIPLCEYCHKKVVHTGKYSGPGLSAIAPTTKLVDNRILHVESVVKPGKVYHTKSLEEKGWIEIDQSKKGQ